MSITKEEFKIQCALICEYCAAGYPVCDCDICSDAGTFVHLGIDEPSSLFEDECKAIQLRILWPDMNSSSS